MAASIETVQSVVKILEEEIGIKTALRVVNRLVKETKGNNSYNCTIERLMAELIFVKGNIR